MKINDNVHNINTYIFTNKKNNQTTSTQLSFLRLILPQSPCSPFPIILLLLVSQSLYNPHCISHLSSLQELPINMNFEAISNTSFTNNHYSLNYVFPFL